MRITLTPDQRRYLRLRTAAANQRTDALNICAELARHAVMGVDIRLVPTLVCLAAEQWVSAIELEETACGVAS